MRFSKHFFSNFFLIINIYISFYFCVTRDKTSVPLLAIAIQTSLEVYYREFSLIRITLLYFFLRLLERNGAKFEF